MTRLSTLAGQAATAGDATLSKLIGKASARSSVMTGIAKAFNPTPAKVTR